MKNQIIVKENKQGKKLLFNVHVLYMNFYAFITVGAGPNPRVRLGSARAPVKKARLLY